MDKKILAIGGHVIKTARVELEKVIERGHVEMLIHNGGSIFHDFQLATCTELASRQIHSYPLDEVVEDPNITKKASIRVWEWVLGSKNYAPAKSITHLCQGLGIPVLMFTIPGADFWHLFKGGDAWSEMGRAAHHHFGILRMRLRHPFHYVCMGSAVVHPEIFTKAIAGNYPKPREFQADVVDFKMMYRPETRVAKYGNYYVIPHKQYLQELLQNRV